MLGNGHSNRRSLTTASTENTVLSEAQNLIALTRAQTPLKGGESTPLTGNFSSLEPRKSAIKVLASASPLVHRVHRTLQTPNPLLTPAVAAGMGGRTPRATPGRMGAPATPMGGMTPLRDGLQINRAELDDLPPPNNARAEKRAARALRARLKVCLTHHTLSACLPLSLFLSPPSSFLSSLTGLLAHVISGWTC